MKIFCKFTTVNISKLNFWLVICIAKNFIWTTLKVIFSIFRFFLCTVRFQIFKILSYHNKPYINGKLIYSAFRRCINLDLKKIDPYDWFCAPGSHFCSHQLLAKVWRRSRNLFQAHLSDSAHLNRRVWLKHSSTESSENTEDSTCKPGGMTLYTHEKYAWCVTNELCT